MEDLLLSGGGIKGMPTIPDLISAKGVVKVERGLVVQEVVVVSPIVEFTNRINFEHDFFWTATEGDPIWMALVQTTTPEELNRIATLVEISIMNRSGADDIYSWYLWNATTEEILLTVEDVAITNKVWMSWHLIIGPDKIRDGDSIYFIIYDGVLGTHGTEPILGSMSFNMSSLTDARSFAEWMGVAAI